MDEFENEFDGQKARKEERIPTVNGRSKLKIEDRLLMDGWRSSHSTCDDVCVFSTRFDVLSKNIVNSNTRSKE